MRSFSLQKREILSQKIIRFSVPVARNAGKLLSANITGVPASALEILLSSARTFCIIYLPFSPYDRYRRAKKMNGNWITEPFFSKRPKYELRPFWIDSRIGLPDLSTIYMRSCITYTWPNVISQWHSPKAKSSLGLVHTCRQNRELVSIDKVLRLFIDKLQVRMRDKKF